MAEWLYGENGYYENYKEIGKEGDFYTAVSSSQFFGGSIAKKIIDSIDSGKLSQKTTVCEIGAHKGYLIADIVQFIYTLRPELLQTLSFAIVERYEKLREKQKSYLQESFGDAVEFKFYGSLDEFRSEETFFIANEIFDAFPCELYHNGKIATVENHKIEFTEIDNDIVKLAESKGKERGEFAVGYRDFAERLFKSSKRSIFLSFDYGDRVPRFDFSTRVYTKHRVFPIFEEGLNLEKLFKTSDITFDVDFDHLISEFDEIGFQFVDYKTQSKALVDFGITELLQLLQQNSSEKAYKSELNRVKVLIDPAFLGERFKMVEFHKGI
jgi:SAM-dependent MidA family methyltransferase